MSLRNFKDGPEFLDLPDDIISDIFSRYLASTTLTNKQAIRLGFLSEAIFREVQKRSALIYEESESLSELNSELQSESKSVEKRRRPEEITYMCDTLRRYEDQNIHLETLTFKFRGSDPRCKHTAYQCIDLASKRSLKSLNLSRFEKVGSPSTVLLPEPVYGVESLVQLSLRGWNLQVENSQWPNLKQLCLDSVNLDSTFFASYRCPLIENLKILGCYDQGHSTSFNFVAWNLSNLKQLTIHLRCSGQTFEVYNAPNLESMTISFASCSNNFVSRGAGIPIRNFGTFQYQNLRTLSLGNFCCQEMDDSFFAKISHEFEQLQVLSISGNEALQRISLSIPTLKKIRLADMRSLEEGKFDVPNIDHFEFELAHYFGETNVLPKLSFKGNPDGWMSDITLVSHPSLTLQLNQQLEEFMANLNTMNSKVSLHFL